MEWILVPKNPTEEMIKAGGSWSGLPSATWQDMLDAAPMCDDTVAVPIELLVDIWCELYYGVGGKFGICEEISQWNLDKVVDILADADSLPIPATSAGEILGKLKPCPFCGGKAAEPDGNNHTWCSEISCGSDAYMSVEAWNRRPPMLCDDKPALPSKLTEDDKDDLRRVLGEALDAQKAEAEYQRGAEEEFRSHVQRLYRERGW